MRIACPFCGARDVQEFTYLGDAALRDRPNGPAPGAPIDHAALTAWHDYVYLRKNVAEAHAELWYHGAGCRQWLTVTRDLRTHEILHVEAARSDDKRNASA